MSSNLKHVSGSLPRIRILRVSDVEVDPNTASDEVMAFITIGAGETHVSVLDSEGLCRSRWAAMFGWSFLFSLPVDISGKQVLLDEEAAVARALKGHALVFGRQVDMTAWISDACMQLTASLEDIMHQTIGSGIHLNAIVLAAPEWLHCLMGDALDLRPHIKPEIRQS